MYRYICLITCGDWSSNKIESMNFESAYNLRLRLRRPIIVVCTSSRLRCDTHREPMYWYTYSLYCLYVCYEYLCMTISWAPILWWHIEFIKWVGIWFNARDIFVYLVFVFHIHLHFTDRPESELFNVFLLASSNDMCAARTTYALPLDNAYVIWNTYCWDMLQLGCGQSLIFELW